MKWCPYCGAELKRGATECLECEKSLGGKQDIGERKAFSSRDAYEKKTIPVWLFVVIVGIFIFGLVLIFVR